jgi:hypothetical protein
MKEITLTQGKVALVDDDTYEYLNQFKWFAHKNNSGPFYAVRTDRTSGKQIKICMHRLIMGISDPKILVDHKDRDGLNNQRYNLRMANKSQNNANRRARRNGSSKYLGVCWDKREKKWRVQIKKNGIIKHVGMFSNEDDAALAYNEKAIVMHGDFARLNTCTKK